MLKHLPRIHLLDRIQRAGTRSPGTYAILVLILGLVIAVTLWQFITGSVDKATRARFETESDRITNVVQRRMIAHEQILRGARALFDSHNGWVTREQWRAYVAALKLDDNFPGVQGVGFSLRIPQDGLEAHITQVRKEGFPDYTVRPNWDRPEYTAIIYLEPFWGRNLRAFGFDMSTEPTRRDAIERARDTGEAALSGRVKLVQETEQDVQPGFLLYLPVYRQGMPRATVAERQEAILGYVYSPYRARDMFGSLLSSVSNDVGMDIYAGHQVSPDTQLYSTLNRVSTHKARFEATRTIHYGGMDWTLKLYSQPDFETGNSSGLPVAVLILTIAASGLLAFVVRTLATNRNQATEIAQEMTNQFVRSEGRLQAVLDSAADGILTVDVRGRVESLNRSAQQIFETDFTAIGKPLHFLVDELTIARIWALLGTERQPDDTAMAARSAYLETLGNRAGRPFPISVSLSEIHLDEELRFSLIVRDITRAKEAEATLRLRDRVIEASSNGIVISDARLPGNPLIYVNPGFERITGYLSEEALGRNCSFLQGEDRDQKALVELRMAIETRQPVTVLLRNYRKRGDLFWNELTVSPVFDEQGTLTHFVGIQNDVTERMIAQETLERRTQRLDSVFTLSPDGFVAFNGRGRVSDANPAFLRMTGLQMADIANLYINDLDALLKDLCDTTQPYHSLLDANPKPDPDDRRAEVRHVIHLKGPQQRILQWSIHSERSRSGDRVAYFRDITRETEVDRIKSEFLSTAAHELRTPMVSVYGFSELLVKRDYPPAKQKDMLQTINRQSGVLINLINELLDLARIEARAGKDFKISRQPLEPLIRNTVASILMHDDPREVDVQLPVMLPAFDVDPEKFSQALLNVVSNAYKYSPDGGAIELDIVDKKEGERGFLGVRVRDHGIGMKPEHTARLFERFFRADPSGNIPGTGLGMCIVREIMELHNGSVDVESEYGQGTTITLWLPIPDHSPASLPVAAAAIA